MDKKKTTVKIKEIQRNKGLGEMSPEAFKYVLSRDNYTKIIIDEKADAEFMLHTCFGKDTQLRKDLLIDHDDVSVDLGNKTTNKTLDAFVIDSKNVEVKL